MDKKLSHQTTQIQHSRHHLSLQNASKTGDITKVLQSFSRILSCCCSWWPVPSASQSSIQHFRIWTRFIFFQGAEDKSPLYYASTNGQTHLVEFFLSLYILSCVRIQGKQYIDEKRGVLSSHTFEEWFQKLRGTAVLGLAQRFTMKDFQLCIERAPTEIRNVFTKRKIHMNQAISIVKKVFQLNDQETLPPARSSSYYGKGKPSFVCSLYYGKGGTQVRMDSLRNHIRRMLRGYKSNKGSGSNTKKSKLPTLNCVHELDVTGFNDDDFDHWYGESEEEEDYNQNEYAENENIDKSHVIVSDNSEGVDDDSEEEEDNDSISYFSRPEIVQHDNYLSGLTNDENSYSSEWEDWDNDEAQMTNGDTKQEIHNDGGFDLISHMKEDREESIIGWDVVSDVQSVMSMDSFATTATEAKETSSSSSSTFSYRNALLKVSAAPTIVVKPKEQEKNIGQNEVKEKVGQEETNSALQKPITSTIRENDDDEVEEDMMQDPYLDREGIKYARGGGYTYKYGGRRKKKT